MGELSSFAEEDRRPLSYADMRRLVLLVVGLLLAAAAIYALAPQILLFVFVFFLAMVLNAPVSWLERRGVKRGLSVVLVLIALAGILAAVVALVVPPVLDQGNQLVENSGKYKQQIEAQVDRLVDRYPALEKPLANMQTKPEDLGTRLTRVSGWLLQRVFGVVGALFLGILSFLVLVFTLMNPRPLVAGLLSATPTRYREATRRSLARMMLQMTAWAKATIINGSITGVMTAVLLYFVGLPYAFVFGMLAFFGEFVPNVGPLVAAIPSLFVALSIGPDKLLWTIGAILFVQCIASNVLQPFIMGRHMELHPVTIVFFAVSMGALFDIAGAILAVPLAATAKILIDEFYLRPQQVPLEHIDALAGDVVNGCGLPEVEESVGEGDAAAAEKET
jgi:predicted PurR-regulated permease PerM